jgi:AcrR family transcriptional regulator
MARRWEHSKEELRTMLLDAAKSIIVKEGVAGLSARKIATKIGYTATTIYFFFKNLDELILHINAETLDRLSKKLLESVSKTKKASQQLESIADAYLSFATNHQHLWQLLFEYNYPNLGEDLPEWYQEKIKSVFAVPTDVLDNFIKDKALVRTKVQVLWAGLHGIATLHLKGKLLNTKAEKSSKLLAEFMAIFMQSLKLK